MAKKFAVFGLGQFGQSIASSLSRRGAEVIAIDRDIDKVENIKDEVSYAVALNSTDIKALKAQNIQDVDAAIVAIGDDFESLLLTTVILQDLQVKRIISRAATDQQKLILKKIGIDEILSPEETVGKRVAEMLLHGDILSYLPLPDDYEIVEVETPAKIVDKRVAEIKFKEKYKLNLITIKRVHQEKEGEEYKEKEHIIGVPQNDTTLNETDILFLMGKSDDINKFRELNN